MLSTANFETLLRGIHIENQPLIHLILNIFQSHFLCLFLQKKTKIDKPKKYMMRFIDIKNDVAFRKIFGNQKKSIVLISFLNAVLDLQGLSCIRKVSSLDPNLLPRIAGEKTSNN